MALLFVNQCDGFISSVIELATFGGATFANCHQKRGNHRRKAVTDLFKSGPQMRLPFPAIEHQQIRLAGTRLGTVQLFALGVDGMENLRGNKICQFSWRRFSNSKNKIFRSRHPPPQLCQSAEVNVYRKFRGHKSREKRESQCPWCQSRFVLPNPIHSHGAFLVLCSPVSRSSLPREFCRKKTFPTNKRHKPTHRRLR